MQKCHSISSLFHSFTCFWNYTPGPPGDHIKEQDNKLLMCPSSMFLTAKPSFLLFCKQIKSLKDCYKRNQTGCKAQFTHFYLKTIMNMCCEAKGQHIVTFITCFSQLCQAWAFCLFVVALVYYKDKHGGTQPGLLQILTVYSSLWVFLGT